jgi:hypothetical protein
LTHYESTSYHESGHSLAAEHVGWAVREQSIERDEQTFGRVIVSVPPTTTEALLADYALVLVSGPIGERLANRDPWRHEFTPVAAVLREDHSDDFIRAARRIHPEHTAEWLADLIDEQAERAAGLLEHDWHAVVIRAFHLMRQLTAN